MVIQILPPITLVQSLFSPSFTAFLIFFFLFLGTAENVTHWGYSDAARDPPTNKSFGGHSEFFFSSNKIRSCYQITYILYQKSSQTPETQLAQQFPR